MCEAGGSLEGNPHTLPKPQSKEWEPMPENPNRVWCQACGSSYALSTYERAIKRGYGMTHYRHCKWQRE